MGRGRWWQRCACIQPGTSKNYFVRPSIRYNSQVSVYRSLEHLFTIFVITPICNIGSGASIINSDRRRIPHHPTMQKCYASAKRAKTNQICMEIESNHFGQEKKMAPERRKKRVGSKRCRAKGAGKEMRKRARAIFLKIFIQLNVKSYFVCLHVHCILFSRNLVI